MAALFADLWDRFLEADFIKNVSVKYHYGEDQETELRETAEEMLPLMRRDAFWERRELFGEELLSVNSGNVYEKVVISLGGGVDGLQEYYNDRERLTRSYMIEVLASEILLYGYEVYNRYVREHTDLHVARYHFPGSEENFPIAMLPGLLKDLTDKVICNKAFCMQPKKSVVFVAELTSDESVQCVGVCVCCQNAHCPNRVEDGSPQGRMLARMADLPLHYGYGRIFGVL